MEIRIQPTFLAALKEIMKTGVATIALSTDELFFMANEQCPKEQRIRYGTFQRFIDSLNEYSEPTAPNEQTALLLEIYDYIKAQQAKQKMEMLNGIMKAEKDWRRFVWLLQWQQKQERQKAADGKQLAKEEKERQQAAAAVAKITEGAEGKVVKLPVPEKEEAPLVNETSKTDTDPALNNNTTYQELRRLGKVR